MKIKRFEFPDLIEIVPIRFLDSRGYFHVTYDEQAFKKAVINTHYVQDNESFSKKGVIRGLHFQKEPHGQGKLVRVISGRVQDVVVDLRKGSPTYLKWKSFIVSSKKGNLIYVPEGFAHGFLALEESIFSYKCTKLYNKEAECGIRWDDKSLNIAWEMKPIFVSEKDQMLLSLEDATHSH